MAVAVVSTEQATSTDDLPGVFRTVIDEYTREALAILRWLGANNIDCVLSDPGKPWQNATDETFNGKLRDEGLSLEWFRTRHEAIPIIEIWRRHHDEVRPHSSLDDLTPLEFRREKPGTTNPQPGEAVSR